MTDHDFAYWWSTPREWVEPANERRGGWSGMMLLHEDGLTYFVKRQCDHLCRTLRHPFGWPTASREWHYLNLLRGLGVRVPEPVFHGVRRQANGTEAVLVTGKLEGFADLSAQVGLTAAEKLVLARELGRQLARLHRARLQHNNLYDKHIMVRWQDGIPEIALIDLERMRRRLTRQSAARHDLAKLKRRQRTFGETEWQALTEAHREAMASR
jgi:tRNA A-37 threonylcarbamoyl transferase component Bud32